MPQAVIIPQADSSIKGGRTGETPILAAAARTASDTAGPWPVDFFSSAEITFIVTSCSGSLNVYVQKLLPDNATYQDIAAFPQIATATTSVSSITTTGTYTFSFVNGGNSIIRQESTALTNSTTVLCHFGNYWRINWTQAGTGATATFGVYGSFKR